MSRGAENRLSAPSNFRSVFAHACCPFGSIQPWDTTAPTPMVLVEKATTARTGHHRAETLCRSACNINRSNKNGLLSRHSRPDRLNQTHFRSYQASLLRERKMRPLTVRLHVAALRFFFVKTLKRRYLLDDTPYPKAPQRASNPISVVPRTFPCRRCCRYCGRKPRAP